MFRFCKQIVTASVIGASSLAATATSAALLDVTLRSNVTATDFTLGTDTVFGVAPSDFTYALTLQVDTTAGAPVFAPAGAPTDTFTFAHDVFGYNVVSASATFGSKTWDNADLLTLSFGDGIANSKLFVNAELVAGATPTLASIRLQDEDGFLIFGSRICGGVCQIAENFEVIDFNGVFSGVGNDVILADNYEVTVSSSEVPEPTPLALAALGLFAIGYARRRR